MHLKSLELTGFKSFAEAKVEFPQGITAVVGPNGTGKSNVVDAILWVLGEQSPKTLRSERMEDVIFNGTQARKPLGMAEVSLIISGMGDQLPPGIPVDVTSFGGFHEVMITRRLYRNGDSEYLINKTLCRLKDIRSLLLDTRAGAKGHTVIEQGRIQHILDASPQDRRELIEETAGIVRYKKQKAEALRRLDATQQNLLRVRDIIGEVRKQLNSLDRQARQARSYQKLQQEARTLEIRLLVQEYRALLQDRVAVESEAATLESQESRHAAEQALLGSRLEEVRLRMLAGEESISRIREELAQVDQQRSQAVTAIEVERNRQAFLTQQRTQAQEEIARLILERERTEAGMTDLRAQLSQSETELASGEQVLAELETSGRALALRRDAAGEEEEQARKAILDVTVQVTSGQNVLAELERQREEGMRRAERLRIEQREVEGQQTVESDRLRASAQSRVEAETRLRDLHGRQQALVHQMQEGEGCLRDMEQRISLQQQELAAAESRWRALQGVFREETGYGREGEEEATSLRAACSGVREAVAEWLIVPPGLDRAIEAVLGERVRAWLVEGPSEAKRAVEFLKARGLGRGAFVPILPRWVARPAGQEAEAWWPALHGQAGVVGLARELLRAPGESAGALACLFDGMVIVETLDVAVSLWERGLWSAPGGPTLVTLDGEVLDPSGVVTGGTVSPVGGVLQRRRQIQGLEGTRAELVQSVEDLQRSRTQLLSEGESGKRVLQRVAEEIRETEMHLLTLAKEEAGLTQAEAGLARRIDTLQTERKMVEEERCGMDAEIEAARQRLAHLLQEQSVREAGYVAASEARHAIEGEGQTLQQRVVDARLVVEGLRNKLQHGGENLTRLIKEREDRDVRVAVLDRQIQSVDEQLQQSRAELDRNTALFQESDGRAIRVQAALVSAQETQAEEAAQCRQVESNLTVVRQALQASREARTGVEIRRAEIKTRMATLESTLTGTYQLSLAEALTREPEPQNSEASEAVEETPHVLRDELQKVRDRIDRMGPINLAAIEEHRELEERYRFLTAQEADLAESIKSLKEIISRINRTTKEMFVDTFNALQVKFGEVFSRFFPGGRAELVLIDPEETPEAGPESAREPGVDIVAQPPGKRLKSIAMLSGGEKTLTAMALIFASFLIKPTPFCILDEIDAPLDEENIGRFTSVLMELAEGAQFIVITHNKRTMAVADSLFGVTMEEPGVSKLVSVRIADLQPA